MFHEGKKLGKKKKEQLGIVILYKCRGAGKNRLEIYLKGLVLG